MSKLKIIFLLFGLFILFFLFKEIGFIVILEQIKSIGWAFLFILFFPIAFQEASFALAWQYSINGKVPGFCQIFFANIAGASVSYITPGTLIGGEPMRVFLLRHHAGMHSSTASVIISRTTKAMGTIIFVFISLCVSLLYFQMSSTVKVALAIVIFLLTIGIFAFLYLQKVGIFSKIRKWVDYVNLPGAMGRRATHLIQQKGHHLEELDRQLIQFYKHETGRFYFSWIISVIGTAIGALEIYFFLRLLGMPVSGTTALAIEALSLVINSCFIFMPGGIGTQEAGKVFIFKILGLLADTGLAVGLFRRMRETVWTLLGLVIFAFYKTAKVAEEQSS